VNCRICGAPSTPVLSLRNSLKTQSACPTLEDALRVPTVDLEVRHCGACDFYQIDGSAFRHYDDEDYFLTTQVSESQRAYQRWLLERLAGVLRPPVAEIGPGDGHFGALVSALHPYLGFEPAGKSFEACRARGLDVVRRYFRPDGNRYGTVVLRQVLEHVEEPVGFLRGILGTLSEGGAAVVEVPNIDQARLGNRLADFCPEHPGYFTVSSLALAMGAAGFALDSIEKTFGGEYLLAVGRPAAAFSLPDRAAPLPEGTVFWGAGSRGISLCHLLGLRPRYFVDADENKWGRFVPSIGTPILPPSALFGDPDCRTVLVASFYYREEIRKALRDGGFAGEILCAGSDNRIVPCG
jgi:hypothetical protein